MSDEAKREEQPEEEQELFEHHHLLVDPGQEPLRIDKFLVHQLAKISRNKLQVAAKAGNVLVHGKPVKANYKVKPTDDISIVMPRPITQHEIIAQDMDLDILHEDADLIVLNKPAGLVVHPGVGNWDGTLVNGLVHHFEQSGSLGQITTEDERPGLVHRLDKDTSGIMVVGKTDYAVSFLARQFFERTVQRSYMALAWGDLENDEGTIEVNVGRHKRHWKMQDAFPDGDSGKHAVTHYKVLDRFYYTTLVECKLETGRTHQIRVHFKYLGHPLFNDSTYGGDRIAKGTVYTKYKQFVDNCFKMLPRQALHAKTLGFIHPTTGEEMFFETPPPNDLKEVIEKWSAYSNALRKE